MKGSEKAKKLPMKQAQKTLSSVASRSALPPKKDGSS
jgi:hypothetical protein